MKNAGFSIRNTTNNLFVKRLRLPVQLLAFTRSGDNIGKIIDFW